MSFLRKPAYCQLCQEWTFEIDVSHIPGAQNVEADDLSRWDQKGPIPHSFKSADRIHINLDQIWNVRQQQTLVPADAVIPWSLPK